MPKEKDISIIHDFLNEHTDYRILRLMQEKKQLGGFQYYFDSDKGYWELEDIYIDNETQRGKKWSSALLQEFVHEVGFNQPIHGTVIHEPTIELLEQQYATQLTKIGDAVLIENPSLQIPIIHILSKGNIQVSKLTISLLKVNDELDIPYDITIWGKTVQPITI